MSEQEEFFKRYGHLHIGGMYLTVEELYKPIKERLESGRKIIAMIPGRLGSQRIKKKNLRLICVKPLIAFIIETAKKAQIFDEIYLNSEAEIFAEIADHYGIQFYKRPAVHASNTATNDDFALDFMEHVPGDILIQLLPTSPLLSSEDVKSFVNEMLTKKHDTLVSVEHKQISCLYQDKPINFEIKKANPPSQTMTPVKAYATALMGWKYDNFQQNMKKYGCAYHGGDGNIGYFELRGLATIDIDREEDFILAEKILMAMSYEGGTSTPSYYSVKEDLNGGVEWLDTKMIGKMRLF